MPIRTCAACDAPNDWGWEQAFYRDGFNNGAASQTRTVQATLEEKGYDVTLNAQTPNPYINSIKHDGEELIASHDWPGDTDAREILPEALQDMLDARFPNPPLFHVRAIPTTFEIDEPDGRDEYLHVRLPGLCTVIIKRTDEGVIVDVWPLKDDAPPAGTLAVWKEDLLEDEGDDELEDDHTPQTLEILRS